MPARAVPPAVRPRGRFRCKGKKNPTASKQATSRAEGGKVLSSPRAPLSTNRVQTNETHDDPRLHPILPKLPTKA